MKRVPKWSVTPLLLLFLVLIILSGTHLERSLPFVTLIAVAGPAFAFGYVWASVDNFATEVMVVIVGVLVGGMQLAGQYVMWDMFGGPSMISLLPPVTAATSFLLGHFFGQPEEPPPASC